MALITVQLTLSGAAQGDQLSTVGQSNGVAVGDKGICQMIVTSPAAAITYGPQFGGTFTSTPDTMAGATTRVIGPFPSSPTRTKEWFFKGTAAQVVTITLITH